MKKQRKGFSLIEILVVFAILGVVIGIGVSVMSAGLKSAAKTTVTNKVKQNGDFVIETITRSIRSAPYVRTQGGNKQLDICSNSACTTPTTSFICIDPTGSTNGFIRRVEGGNTVTLTSTDVTQGVNVASCTFTVDTSVNPARVTIQFTLTQGVGLTGSEDLVSIPFRTQVSLRTYGQ